MLCEGWYCQAWLYRVGHHLGCIFENPAQSLPTHMCGWIVRVGQHLGLLVEHLGRIAQHLGRVLSIWARLSDCMRARGERGGGTAAGLRACWD